jgi:dynein heavy chain
MDTAPSQTPRPERGAPAFAQLRQFAPAAGHRRTSAGGARHRRLAAPAAAGASSYGNGRGGVSRAEMLSRFSGYETCLHAELGAYQPPSSPERLSGKVSGGHRRSPLVGGRAARANHGRLLLSPMLADAAVLPGDGDVVRRERVPPERVPSGPALAASGGVGEGESQQEGNTPQPQPRPQPQHAPSPTLPPQQQHISVEHLQTAWDAMEYFMRVNSETEARIVEAEPGTAPRFVHLNVVVGRDFRPYDLVVTDELHKNPEHWTMSHEGMLHVIPGEDSEFLTLGEWSSNAIAFSSCCRIPFFRSYAVRIIYIHPPPPPFCCKFAHSRRGWCHSSQVTKGFHGWRRRVRHRAFCKRRKLVGDQLFGHRKSFRSTYRLIQTACSSIREAQLSNIELRRMYTLEDFETEQQAVRVRGGKAVHEAIDNMRQELVWLCDQLEQRKRESALKDRSDDREMARAIESHMSMSEVKAEQQKRARLLAESLSEAVEVGTFVRLADLATVESQLHLATDTVVGIHHLLQQHLKEVSQGMFVVTVNMTAKDIVYAPTRESFVHAMRDVIHGCQEIVVKAPRLSHVKQLNSHVESDVAQFSSVADLLGVNKQFDGAVQELMRMVHSNYDQVISAGAMLEDFREMYDSVTTWNLEDYIYNGGQKQTPQSLQDDLRRALQWKQKVAKQMKVSTECGIFHLDTRALRDRVRPLVDTTVQDLKRLLSQVAGEQTNAVWTELQMTIKRLNDRPKSIEDFSDLMVAVKGERSELYAKVKECDQMYGTLRDTGIKLTPQENLKLEDVHENVELLQEATGKALRHVDDLMERMCAKLDESLRAENEELSSILLMLNSPEFTNPQLSPAETSEKLERVGRQLHAAERSLEQNMKYEQQFRDLALPDRAMLDETLKVFEYRTDFWTKVSDWKDSEDTWLATRFIDLNVQEVSDTVTSYLRAAQQLFRVFKEPVVLHLLKANAEKYQQWIPSLFLLGNPAMQTRHWKTIFEHLEVPLPADMEFNLKDLIAWQIFDNKTVIQEISAHASGEWALAQSLRKVETSMDEAKFDLSEHQEAHILSNIDDLYAVLDENKMTLQIMRSSRFIAGVKPDVESWERKLRLVDEVLDEWLFCQRNWLYLLNIFGVPDIQKQLPSEAMDFQHVDSKWREIMMKTKANPNVMDSTTAPGVLEMFLENKELLQKVQSSLDEYLETKRAAFPRFYFLSDDELLQILSHVKNPRAVQPHMSKLFSGIKRLDFKTKTDKGEPLKSGALAQVPAMYSAEAEEVVFDTPITIGKSANIENWLNEVERRMIRTMYSETKEAYYAARDMVQHHFGDSSRKEWLFNPSASQSRRPAMCVLTVEQVLWQEEITGALMSPKPQEQLRHIVDVSEPQKLQELTGLVCSELDPQQRKVVEALLVLSIHARDVSVQLFQKRTGTTADFNWLRQLRYAWDADSAKLGVNQVRASFEYRYEYLGNSSRLVITPLTDRCYLTLTNALDMRLGGCPYGKAGTGKTESVKDLAKALARQCIVFNCSDGLDFQTMGRFFSGLAQAGAWACFDEFNRIDVEVLSVVAQQCLTIQQALMGEQERFTFDGRYIPLDRNYGCFVTMNPSAGGSYGGRAELPDNLKSMFRPVAMQTPDVFLIAQNMLYAQGFLTAGRLARKIVHLYRLASDQLSQQKHYDWMLRAMKPVLSVAGSMKRAAADSGESEEQVLIHALQRSNTPKLVGNDLALFQALLTDLFPGVQAATKTHGSLQMAITECLKLRNLTVEAKFVDKIVQMRDTLQGRHGVGLVGAPGSGKSVAREVLADAFSKRHDDDKDISSITQVSLNPKAVSIGKLYGEFNEASAEWTDGLVPALIRQFLGYRDYRADTTKWLTFDGPVDAYWIESMNTVLDDNKLLCLTNGERIKLPANINLLFEVEGLTHASPATISRIGMVYFDESQVSWSTIVKAWCATHSGQIFPFGMEKLLSSIIAQALSFYEENKHSCPNHMATTDAHRITTFLGMLHTLTSMEYVDDLIPPVEPGPGSRELEIEQEQAIVAHPDFFTMSLTFSFVWSFGASVLSDSQLTSSFEDFARRIVPDFCSNFPVDSDRSAFDSCIDYSTMEWASWTSIIPQFQYNVGMSEQLVPTATTTRTLYVLRVLMRIGSGNVVLSGNSSVGKTSIVNQFVTEKHPDLSFTSMSFTSTTSTDPFYNSLEKHLEQRGKEVLAPPSSTKMVACIDDLSMPQADEFGTQPTSECVRQLVDCQGYFDRKGWFWKKVEGTQVLATVTPPGSGHRALSRRLTRHFHVLCLAEHSDSDLETIFGGLLHGLHSIQDAGMSEPIASWLSPLSAGIVSASIHLLRSALGHLLPTPAKCHYIFNLRDILRVFAGLKSFQLENLKDEDQYIRLWAHEARRVFADRLNDKREVQWFVEAQQSAIQQFFDKQWQLDDFIPSCFGSFGGSQSKDYLERVIPACVDGEALASVSKTRMAEELAEALENYNFTVPIPMEMVLFDDVMAHICNTCRVLSQARGNMLLLGLSGCGRRSVVKLAAHLMETQMVEVTVGRGYGVPEFRDDLKNVISQVCGANTDKPVVFFLAEAQIMDERFLQDINDVMSTGYVSGLFSDEELNALGEDTRGAMKKDGIPVPATIELSKLVARRVMDKLHIIVSLAPDGISFSERMRLYPALGSWCTIDWYHPWTEGALLDVASRHLKAPDRPATEEQPDEHDEDASSDILSTHMDVVCKLCVMMTKRVNWQIQQMAQTKLEITPKFFVELLKLFKTMIIDRNDKLNTNLARLHGGLDKLHSCNRMVESLHAELEELQPQIAEMTEETITLVGHLAADKEAADSIQVQVRREQNRMEDASRKCDLIRKGAQKELDAAMPAFNSALKALETLNRADLTEVKSFAQPPDMVRKVMEAVCVLMKCEASWKSAQKLLTNIKFIDTLRDFDKDNIADETRNALSPYVNDPTFQPDKVAKVSVACKTICMWVVAIDTYAEVIVGVRPKQARLRDAQERAFEFQRELQIKQRDLDEVTERVDALQHKYDESLRRRDDLDNQMHDSKIRISRAEKLTTQLADEQIRWSKMATNLESDRGQLVGDTLLAAAFIGYAGSFDAANRAALINSWIRSASALELPINTKFSLEYTLGDPVTIREWKLQGLPADPFSVDNALIVWHTRRWPLLTDPQEQGGRWIKRMEQPNGLNILNANDPNMLRTVEQSIQMGIPVLLQNVGETMDPSLRPVFENQVAQVGGRTVIQLGGVDIDYNPEFRLYVSCSLPNPKYSTEIHTILTVVNFVVTRPDLEEQLLTMAVAHERPDLEQEKDRLVLEINTGQTHLNKVEDEILDMLKSASGNILSNESLITQLDGAKMTAETVMAQLEKAEHTSAEINSAREAYRVVATRGSVLYFAIASMSSLNPMYQYSLEFFRALFNNSLTATSTVKNTLRLPRLVNTLTERAFDEVCHGLFEKDKMLFSFVIATQTCIESGSISAREWDFFVRGPSLNASADMVANPCSSWIADNVWHRLDMLSKLSGFEDILYDIEQEQQVWQDHLKQPKMYKIALPGRWGASLSAFQKLLLNCTLRSDVLEQSVVQFVDQQLGRRFVEPAHSTLAECFKESSATIPMLFILSPAADPTTELLAFTKDHINHADTRLEIVSLGQGQGPRADFLIRKACREGTWVCLQNCHLALSWMPQLQALVDGLESFEPAAGFRLWLTSYPSPSFPVGIVQRCIKIATELPRGLRANLLRTYRNMSAAKFEEVKSVGKGKLMFALAFFHAAVLDRCTYGAIGFNIPCEWTVADLDVSISLLTADIDANRQMTATLLYMVGKVHYGGRVTDPFDQRCVQCLLLNVLRRALGRPDDPFDDEGVSNGNYHAPSADSSQQDCIEFIESLPLDTNPAVSGLHKSANVKFRLKASEALMRAIVETSQCTVVKSATSISSDKETVIRLSERILSQMGHSLTLPTQSTNELDAMQTVLRQEVARYNSFHAIVNAELHDLQNAVAGRGIMTQKLNRVYTSLLIQAVPDAWLVAAGNSTATRRSIGSWLAALARQTEFLQSWCSEGSPRSYYLPGLRFPHGLLAAVTQQYARSHGVASDQLRLHTQVTRLADPAPLQYRYDLQEFGGLFIHGLWLEGGRWDASSGMLLDPQGTTAHTESMPVVWCRPVQLRDASLVDPATPRTSTPVSMSTDFGEAGADDLQRTGGTAVTSQASESGGDKTEAVTSMHIDLVLPDYNDDVLDVEHDGGASPFANDSNASPKALAQSPLAQSPLGTASPSALAADKEVGMVTSRDLDDFIHTVQSPSAASRRPQSPYAPITTPLPGDDILYPATATASFTCPVYKTSNRGGDEGGWIMNCELTTSADTAADHWVLRGTAVHCQHPH